MVTPISIYVKYLFSLAAGQIEKRVFQYRISVFHFVGCQPVYFVVWLVPLRSSQNSKLTLRPHA